MKLRPSFLFVMALCLLSLKASSQFKKIKSISVTNEIVGCAVDRPGDLYLTTADGQCMKYDGDGVLKITLKNNPVPTLFDPHDGARMFAFYRGQRKYEYLNPSFEPTASLTIDSAFVIDPWLACLSGDHNLWIIDAADRGLKKINTKLLQVEADTKINSTIRFSDITCMREYQGFVFMLVRKWGVLIFNSMGKQIKTIENKEISAFNFIGEELYYVHHDTLIFFDLFSTEVREMKMPAVADFAILTDERLYLLKGKTVDIFKSNL